MMKPSALPKTGIWTVAECPFVIEYDQAVLGAVNQCVLDGHRALGHGGLEVGGLLLGSFDGTRLHITGHEAISCEHASGPSFSLSERDRAELAGRLREIAESGESDRRVVGWYHSHTRSGLAMSPEDLAIHEEFFTEPFQVSLILHPVSLFSSRAGFFVRESDGSIRPFPSYQEFDVDGRDFLAQREREPGLSVDVRRARGAEVIRAGYGSREVVPQRYYQPPPVLLPRQPAQDPQTRWMVWSVLGGMLALSAGLVLYLRQNYWHQIAGPAATSFVRIEAVPEGENLKIRWEPKVLANAKAARLEVQDGALRAELKLDGKTLESGAVLYAARSDVAGFHLTAERADGTWLEGSTTYVAPAAPRASLSKAVAAVEERKRRQQETERRQQVEKLKEAEEEQAPDSGTADRAKDAPLLEPNGAAPVELAGNWALEPGATYRAPGTPVAVNVNVFERDGVVAGTLTARYQGSARTPAERLRFSFAGKTGNGVARFPWANQEGTRHGTVEFRRLTPDTAELVFYGSDRKQIYHHIVRKTN